MKLVILDKALAKIDHHINYIAVQGAPAAALKLHERVDHFLSMSLTFTPGNGHYIGDRDLWETWIPGTKFVVWYIFDKETLTVIDFWHTSQDRQGAE